MQDYKQNVREYSQSVKEGEMMRQIAVWVDPSDTWEVYPLRGRIRPLYKISMYEGGKELMETT